MISIKKDFDTPPEKLVQSKRNDQIKDALITKNEHKFKSSIYRKTTIDALETLYNFKCAYCESDTSAGAPFQVEHFRPKAKCVCFGIFQTLPFYTPSLMRISLSR